MFCPYLTLNNHEMNTEDIERKFESTRSSYMRDLQKLRKRYKYRFMKLTEEYSELASMQKS